MNAKNSMPTSHRANAGTAGAAIDLPGGVALAMGCLLALSTLASSGDAFRSYGCVALVAVLLLPGLFYWSAAAMQREVVAPRTTSWIGFLVLAAASAPRISPAFAPPGWGRLLAQIVLVAIFFDSVSRIRWTTRSLALLSIGPLMWITGIFGSWVVSGAQLPYAFVFDNTNPFGASSAALMVLAAIGLSGLRSLPGRIAMAMVVVMGGSLVVASMSRSALLASLVGGAAWFAWGWIERRRFLHRGLFVATLGACLAFVFLQTMVVDWLTDAGYQDLSRRLTGKNVGTRETVWRQIVEVIGDKPWLGHGASTTAADVLGEQLSAHCLYLQSLLQVGIVGLTALIAVLWRAWSATWHGRHDAAVRVAACGFLGALVHQTFEVSLTQNHLSIGCVAWMMLGVACSRSGLLRARSAMASRQRRIEVASSRSHRDAPGPARPSRRGRLVPLPAISE